jgi:hypothetical protein
VLDVVEVTKVDMLLLLMVAGALEPELVLELTAQETQKRHVKKRKEEKG